MQSAILASSPPKAGTTRGGLRLSLSQKLGLLIAVIVCIAVGLTVMLQISQRQQNAVEDFRDANLQIASLVAQQISGGVRWNKPETITPTLEGRSEEHTSELQSLMRNSYAVFCLKKKTKH